MVELLTVVVLMAIALAAVGPPAVQANRRNQVRRAALEVEAAHAAARSWARRYGRTATLTFTSGASQSAWTVAVDTTLDGVTPVDVFARSYDYMTFSFDRAVLCFDGRGLPTQAGSCEAPDATITLSNNNITRTVRFSSAGMLLK
jgi:type II secretory pathway pseudopilin PulG